MALFPLNNLTFLFNETNFTCDIPPPTPEECAQIPICDDQDQIQSIAIGSICSTTFQISSCLAGFMYVDPNNVSAKPPFPFWDSLQLPIDIASIRNPNATCYEKFYPFTRACCPGYYCSPAMYCMMPCTQQGSNCPSSDTAIYPNCNEAHIDVMNTIIIQYPPLMGCGGSYRNDSMCSAGYYCTNSSEKQLCPSRHSCRVGSTEPHKCAAVQYCPIGSSSPQNDTISASIIFLCMLTIIILLGFYDKCKAYGMTLFRKLYMQLYGEDFDMIRIQKNKRKKRSVFTFFAKDVNANYRPYKSVDVTKYNNKLLNEPIEIPLDDGSLATASSASPWDDINSDSEDNNEEKSQNENKLDFFMDIEFKNLSLNLKSNNKTILHDCSGYLHCGTVNAIMGPSGAGKTSFLFTLCGKAAAYGNISGQIFINGELKNINDFSDIVGFVPQSDTMTAEMSVKEMLNFNSKFRLSKNVNFNYRKCVVRDILKLLKIKHIRHSLIGNDIKRGISGGQQKRVNIGMELVSIPSVLFLDEPTSGLDSTTSNDVMEVLKLIANRGTLVLVVLHQPRYEIFTSFDNIILLAEGGQMVYMGDTKKAMQYFQQFGYIKPPKINEADFLMDIISGTVQLPDDKPIPDLVANWNRMDKKNKWDMHINEDYSNNYMDETYKNNSKYVKRSKLSFLSQIFMCTKRSLIISWRQKTNLISDIVMITFIGFIIGYTTDSDDFQKTASNIFNLIITSSIIGCIISLKTFGNDRIMYWRFSSCGINRFSYYIGATIASLPWIILHPLIFLIFYIPMTSPHGGFDVYLIMLMLGMFCAQGLGQFISIIVDPNKSILVSVVIVMIMNFICGFDPTLESYNSIMKVIANLSFARWQQEALWMKEVNAWPQVFETERYQLSQYFGYSLNQSIYIYNIIIMFIIGFVFRVLTFLALIFANRAKQM